jgi:hypothetical protein
MASNPASSTVLNAFHLQLEIPSYSLGRSTSAFSTAGSRRRAALNQMACDAFLPWLQTEQGISARLWPNAIALPSFWELVDGTAIVFNGTRVVLIPSLAIDREEMRVLQEWVDIPGWSADYYLAVQVNPDENWVAITGYTTHHRLKTIGLYDADDRTYSLAGDDLIQDLNVLWLAWEFCPTEPLRTDVSPLPYLPLAQANQLIERLGNPDLIFPRLAIPFHLWGALLAHGGWRQQLYERRQGLTRQWSIPQWLQAGVSAIAQQWGWEPVELYPVTTRSMRSIPASGLLRPLNIAGRLYNLQVFPVEDDRSTATAQVWRFELRPAEPLQTIPAGFKLRLLTEDLQPFANNEDIAVSAVENLYVDVLLEAGEGLVWEIEPIPDSYDREILQF